MNDLCRLHARITARVGILDIDVDFEAGPGALVIVGPNGAGKTSILELLLGALPSPRGRIEVGGVVLLDTALGVDVPLEQRQLGYVPQHYALFPHLSVRENVAFALSCTARVEPSARARRALAILHELGLTALSDRRPATLSGGEKQRLALARALAIAPRALLLDEPLSALDAHARREVRAFLGAYLDKLRLPTLVVTHDAADARALGQRIAVLEAGRLTQLGTWQELAARPASPFVEEFVASEQGARLA